MEKYILLSDGRSPHTWKWAKELIKYFDIYVVSFNGVSPEIESILAKEKIFSLNANVSKDGGNIQSLKLLPKMIDIVKHIKPSFINAHYITSYGTVAVLTKLLSGSKAKLILSMWGSDILITPFKNKIYYFLTKFVLSRANFLTSDSQHMSNVATQICKKQEVMTFPFGLEKFPEVSLEEKDYNYFFSNRGFSKIYNIDLVIEIFEKQHQLNSKCVLYIANDGEEKEYLKKLVENKGLADCVFFLGFLDAKTMEKYYRKCGFYFSLPSSDSTAVSLLEALAYGSIPIVSDLPANHEWITNGENGFIICDNKKDIFKAKVLAKAFEKNRELVKEKAIWNKEIEDFVKNIL